MSFFKSSSIAFVSAIALTACGGSAPDAQEIAEKSIENQTDKADSSVNSTADKIETVVEPAQAAENPFEGLPAPYDTADYKIGKRIFKQCSSCHILKEGGGNLVGPNLYGLFDRNVGEVEGFGYSKALQDADFEWTPEQLDSWLASPAGFLKGNNMSFSGIKKDDQRNGVVAYIMLETGYEADAE